MGNQVATKASSPAAAPVQAIPTIQQAPTPAPNVDELLARRAAVASEPLTTGKGILLMQAMQLATSGFAAVAQAANDAIDLLDEPEVPKTDLTRDLLMMAGSMVVGAGAGFVAATVVRQLTTVLVEKASKKAAEAASSAFRKAMDAPVAERAKSLKELKSAFKESVHLKQAAAENAFVQNWKNVALELSMLTEDQLERLNQLLGNKDVETHYNEIKRQTFVAWTNFLARAKHGAMRGWDPSTVNGSRGALPLKGADAGPAPGRDAPIQNNVAPGAMSWAFDDTQRPMMPEHYGILEIFVYARDHVRVVTHDGYRMRLDNVGPKVREELRTMGRVRDLKVNKIVRICTDIHRGVRVDPPVPVEGVLITADGYIRVNSMSAPVHFKPTKKGSLLDPTGFDACARDLVHGKESNDCSFDHATQDFNAVALAEAAQDLPLTYLEV